MSVFLKLYQNALFIIYDIRNLLKAADHKSTLSYLCGRYCCSVISNFVR